MIVSEKILTKWSTSNRKHFEEKGYLFTGYGKNLEAKSCDLKDGSSIDVKVKCDVCGVEKKIRYSVYVKSVKKKGRYECNSCSGKGKAKYSSKDVEKYLNKFGYSLEDDLGYRKMHDKIKIGCDKGHIYIAKFNSFVCGTRCPVCDALRWNGSKNPRYNPNLTDEQRKQNESRHSNLLYRKWFKSVFRRDNYKCCICEKTNTTLNAHHLDGYTDFPKKRLEVSNGVTLCEECHKKFHKKYGYGHNTEKQFIEFVINSIC